MILRVKPQKPCKKKKKVNSPSLVLPFPGGEAKPI